VDAVKRLGPFTDPRTGLGYPNWSFFLPGHVWMPTLVDQLTNWLRTLRATRGFGNCARSFPRPWQTIYAGVPRSPATRHI